LQEMNVRELFYIFLHYPSLLSVFMFIIDYKQSALKRIILKDMFKSSIANIISYIITMIKHFQTYQRLIQLN
jgi:hypothetical protein